MKPADSPAQDDTVPAKKRRGCGCQTMLLVFVVILVGAALLVVWLWLSEPEYWKNWQALRQTIRAEDRAHTADLLRQQIRAKLVPEDSKQGGTGGVRTIEATAGQLNSWLDTQLTGWLKENGRALPDQVSDVMVAIDGGKFVVAFRFKTSELGQIISLFFDVNIIGDPAQPQLQIQLSHIKAGQLPIPLQAVMNHLKKHETRPAKLALFETVLSAYQGQMFDPIMRVPENKNYLVRLLDFQLRGDLIELKTRVLREQ